MPGSSSCGLGSPPEYVVSASALTGCACAPRASSAFLGVSFLFAASIQRVHSRRASRLTSVPSAAFRTLSTAYSSLYLADLFHPAATSRISAPGFLPRPSCTTSSVAMSSRRWRRVSVAGCPTTPSHVASTSGPRSRSGSAAPPGGLAQAIARVPSRFRLLRTLATDLASAVNSGSTRDLVAHRSSAARAGLGVSIDRQRRCSISRSSSRSRFPTCHRGPGCPVTRRRGPSDSANRFGRRRGNHIAVGVPRPRSPQARGLQPRAALAIVVAPDTLVDNLRARCRSSRSRLAAITRCVAIVGGSDRCVGSARRRSISG